MKIIFYLKLIFQESVGVKNQIESHIGKKIIVNQGVTIMEKKNKELRKKREEVLLTFLKQTKEGKYAKIDESSFPYSRIQEQTEEIYIDEYYYSLR
ncbi:MAG: hypothetical protein GX869_08865 [Candidatus Cloacimonetes bacterium]|jgi:trehalose/maltose hydrolase-like predicted phosphorylase|nr:hypothetical protein [Candidatus Cloacimonadota bacterium]